MTTISRRRFIKRGAGIAAAGMAASATGVLSPGVARGQGVTELKVAHGDPATHPGQQVCMRFAQQIEEKTGGSIKLRVFSGGQLGSGNNLLSGLSTGIVDFNLQSSGFLEQFFPRIMALDLPFLFKDAASAEKLLDGPIGKDLLSDVNAKGIVGLGWGHQGWRVMESRAHAIKVPDDLKGQKMRIQPAPVFASMIKAVGAIPVTLDVTEVYLAISQNTVQGLELPFLPFVASKTYEVVKYVGLTNHVYNAGAMLASKVKLDAMTPKEQEAVREAGHDLTAYWRKLFAEKSLEAQKLCESKGLVINDVDHNAFQKAMNPVYAEFRDKIGVEIVDKVRQELGV